MAKKKGKPGGDAGRSRDPDTWTSKPIVAQVRGSAEWKGWLEEFASRHRQSAAGLIDTALALLAKQTGFRDPPKR